MKRSSSRRAKLQRWFGSEGTALFVLNSKRKLVYFNAGCERLTGAKAADLLGKACSYSSEGEPAETLLGLLAPPPEVWQGQTKQVPAYVPNAEGGTTAVLLHFFPLRAADGHVQGVLGVVSDVPEPELRVRPTLAQQLHAELGALRLTLRRRFGLTSVVGRCDAMQKVLAQVKLAVQSDVPVLLQGERGTGKEHLARVIHTEGKGKGRAFVPLDCELLPPERLEEALRRAVSADEEPLHPGLRVGTLYLSHVECLAREWQQELVRVVKQRAPNAPRLVVSTTGDLHAALEQDRLRPDFFHTVSTLTIELPALRERLEDLPLLVQAFVEQLNRSSDRQIGGVTEPVLEEFRRYNWPGNLDELWSVVSEAWTACQDTTIGTRDLPFRFRAGFDAQTIGPPPQTVLPQPLEQFLEQVERQHIEETLRRCRYNKTKAAELLGLTRARLYRRMQALGIEDREP